MTEHKDNCPHEMVICSNGCGLKFKQHQLPIHVHHTCPKRIVSCVYCHKKDEYQIINSDHHNKECPDYLLPCPNNGCEENIKRRHITQHRRTCPKEKVSCQYYKVGCQDEMKREELPQHNKDKMEEHLGSAVQTIVKLKQQHQDMEEQLREGNHNIEKLKHTIKHLEQQKDHMVTKIKMTGVMALKTNDVSWYSPYFYSHRGGYKLRLVVFANGCSSGEGTHLGCFINLMPRKYDDTLEWPFQGEVTVQLLNQLEDRNHYKSTIPFNDETPHEHKDRKRKEDTNGWGQSQFIPHTDIGLNSSTNTQYLMNDTLYFRVSVNVQCRTKPWLTGAI